MSKKSKSVIIFCAHNDDQLIGAGGTIRKYVDSGIKVYTYIFSYGEMSHPHLRPEVIAKTREKESFRASKLLGDETNYLGLKEGKFADDFDYNKVKKIISSIKPEKIFTHSPDDPHPDHRSVFRLITKTLSESTYKGDLYCFDVWNVFSFSTRSFPKLFIDITDTFDNKVRAFELHKSQLMAKVLIGWSNYVKAIVHGWNNNCKYAELFHKIDIKKADKLLIKKDKKKNKPKK
jgi:LmbE family N-acetylglucosaminyl deacetylase